MAAGMRRRTAGVAHWTMVHAGGQANVPLHSAGDSNDAVVRSTRRRRVLVRARALPSRD